MGIWLYLCLLICLGIISATKAYLMSASDLFFVFERVCNMFESKSRQVSSK